MQRIQRLRPGSMLGVPGAGLLILDGMTLDHVMNMSIEMHDSTVSRFTPDGESIIMNLTPAYLHKSYGQPGIDPGTGWTQDARLVVGGASLVGKLPELPCDIMDGELTIGGAVHRNTIPVPLLIDDAVNLHVVFYPECDVSITGTSIRLELLGEPTYVEEFNP